MALEGMCRPHLSHAREIPIPSFTVPHTYALVSSVMHVQRGQCCSAEVDMKGYSGLKGVAHTGWTCRPSLCARGMRVEVLVLVDPAASPTRICAAHKHRHEPELPDLLPLPGFISRRHDHCKWYRQRLLSGSAAEDACPRHNGLWEQSSIVYGRK